jgi:hypothetical protein
MNLVGRFDLPFHVTILTNSEAQMMDTTGGSPMIPQTGTAQPVNRDQNMWAMLCHLGGLIGLFLPPLNIIAPLVIWLIKKDEYPLVADQGKESINFQISITIYAIISAILILILIGILLLIAIGIFTLIMCIVAMIKANEGVTYRYPLTIRLIK